MRRIWLTAMVSAVAMPLMQGPAPAETGAAGAGETFRDCDACPEMVVIPPGSFLMGAPDTEVGRRAEEGPVHEVSVGGFGLSRTEVTFDQWRACVAAGGCSHHLDGYDGPGDLPVLVVSWEDAQSYATWLSGVTGAAYRLPSEAEWEYAARAGTTTARPWGDDIGVGMASCAGCGNPMDGRRPEPVASFPPNPFGLHDMLGNVWEWTQDCWNRTYEGAPTDGSAWLSGDCERHPIRGGSWDYVPNMVRSAVRTSWSGEGINFLGFRVASSL